MAQQTATGEIDTMGVSLHIHHARERIQKAHNHADTWTEDMEHTLQAIDALGIQHYGQAGENLPGRIIEAQAEAMASLTYTYGEQSYETDELTFADPNERETFEEYLDAGHESAMSALRMVEDARED